MTSAPRFDDALAAALAWASAQRDALGGEVYLLRDIYGRVRVAPGGDVVVPTAVVEALHEKLGSFSPGPASIVVDRTFFSSEELEADRTRLAEGVWLVDHLVSEQGWRRPPVAGPQHRPRITFFGLKGGVGRSTALVAVAKRLAERKLRVLVVDLDLESPGATSMLLRPDELRIDVLDDPEVMRFPDASKLQTAAVELAWRRFDLYGLLWKYLANSDEHADTFRALSEGWRESDGNWDIPEPLRSNEVAQRQLWHFLAGRWMGASERKGDTYPWLIDHLGDAFGRVTPRSFLIAVRKAALTTPEDSHLR